MFQSQARGYSQLLLIYINLMDHDGPRLTHAAPPHLLVNRVQAAAANDTSVTYAVNDLQDLVHLLHIFTVIQEK